MFELAPDVLVVRFESFGSRPVLFEPAVVPVEQLRGFLARELGEPTGLDFPVVLDDKAQPPGNGERGPGLQMMFLDELLVHRGSVPAVEVLDVPPTLREPEDAMAVRHESLREADV